MAFKMKLKTDRQPNGEWTAIDEDTYDGADKRHMMGWGKTEQEAIEDLERLFEERAGYEEMERRQADHVDGYDRDDLGLSLDY